MKKSITLRLSILFALTTIILLTGIGAYLYHFLDNEMTQRDHEELTGKVELFRHQLAAIDMPSKIVSAPNEFRDVIIGHPHLRLALLDKSGHVLLATGTWHPDLKQLQPPVAATAMPKAADIQMPTPNHAYHTV
ncbi:MAG: hypothetical protein ABL868_06935, partial [Sulfuriferula sp.]